MNIDSYKKEFIEYAQKNDWEKDEAEAYWGKFKILYETKKSIPYEIITIIPPSLTEELIKEGWALKGYNSQAETGVLTPPAKETNNIWSDGVEEIPFDIVQKNEAQFRKELSDAGASNDEVKEILDILSYDSCFFQNAKEAVECYREYFKKE